MTRHCCRNCGVAMARGDFPLCQKCFWWRRHLSALRLRDIDGMSYALNRLKALGEWDTVLLQQYSRNSRRA